MRSSSAKPLNQNLEAGLAAHDPRVAVQLDGHVRRLMKAGVLR